MNTKEIKAINTKQSILGVNYNVPINILNINCINVWIKSLAEWKKKLYVIYKTFASNVMIHFKCKLIENIWDLWLH